MLLSPSVRSSAAAPAKEIRTDIQALRGLAVLLVVFYHAGPRYLKAGYLGVDIFFVISGFLITGLIRKQREQGTFHLGDFYARRVRRLLPAAFTVFLLTALASFWLLNDQQLTDFVFQLQGAATLTANHVLSQQGGYFDWNVNLKPLLHVWSLSVEEQYYLLLPPLLWLLPMRFHPIVVGLAASMSFGICLWFGAEYRESAFYLLPTRLWQLGFGSLASMAVGHLRPGALWFWAAVPVLLVVPFYPSGLFHPGLDAFAVCLATAVIILHAHPGLQGEALLPVRLLARTGDMSYSLYLAHWPLFALFANCWYGAWTPGHFRVLLVLASLVCSYALYRGVEQPLRYRSWGGWKPAVGIAVLASVGLWTLGYYLPAYRSPNPWAKVERLNFGFGWQCLTDKGWLQDMCASTPQPKVAVWGDSIAQALVPGLAAEGVFGVRQLTKGGCSPYLDLTRVGTDWRSIFNPRRTRECTQFNRDVFEYIQRTPSIETVVLASLFVMYLDPADRTLWRGKVVETTPEVVMEALEHTVRSLREAGKKVVYVAAPPGAEFDIAGCMERRERGRPIFGVAEDCSTGLRKEREMYNSTLPVEAAIRRFVPVIEVDEAFCSGARCGPKGDGQVLYLDRGHVSQFGSKYMASKLRLSEKILALAR